MGVWVHCIGANGGSYGSYRVPENSTFWELKCYLAKHTPFRSPNHMCLRFPMSNEWLDPPDQTVPIAVLGIVGGNTLVMDRPGGPSFTNSVFWVNAHKTQDLGTDGLRPQQGVLKSGWNPLA